MYVLKKLIYTRLALFPQLFTESFAKFFYVHGNLLGFHGKFSISQRFRCVKVNFRFLLPIANVTYYNDDARALLNLFLRISYCYRPQKRRH